MYILVARQLLIQLCGLCRKRMSQHRLGRCILANDIPRASPHAPAGGTCVCQLYCEQCSHRGLQGPCQGRLRFAGTTGGQGAAYIPSQPLLPQPADMGINGLLGSTILWPTMICQLFSAIPHHSTLDGHQAPQSPSCWLLPRLLLLQTLYSSSENLQSESVGSSNVWSQSFWG